MVTANRRKRRALGIESLESRLCMATSVGWDGPGRGSAALTYYVGPVPSSMGLSRTAVVTAIDRALDAWSDAADIRFTPCRIAKSRENFVTWLAGGSIARASTGSSMPSGRWSKRKTSAALWIC